MKTNFTIFLTIIIFVLLFAGSAASQANTKKTDKQKKDQPIKLKSKPSASTGGKCSTSSGTTTLRVTFDKSAKVTRVDVISSSNCQYFDRSALQAARRIEFEPAIKNGEPITVTKTVVYTFTSY